MLSPALVFADLSADNIFPMTLKAHSCYLWLRNTSFKQTYITEPIICFHITRRLFTIIGILLLNKGVSENSIVPSRSKELQAFIH